MTNRTDIRHGVIAALTNCDVPPYPTMAGDRVYDSRQDPLMHTSEQHDAPVIIVYTDSSESRPINPASKAFLPFVHIVDVVLEMSLASAGSEAETDAENEARLDLFEQQVLTALFDPRSQHANIFGQMFNKLHGIKSMRLANSDHNVRLAQRDLVLTLEYSDRCPDIVNSFPAFARYRAIVANGNVNVTTIAGELEQ